MISVVIPTCDRPIAFLNEAIGSVLEQSLKPSEIIVVDNGSSAVDQGDLAESIILHRLQPFVGPSRARNFGAAIAVGDFLAFLDDDDIWDPDFLKEAYSTLKSDGTACVYGRIDAQRGNERIPFKEPSSDTLNIPTLVQRNPGTGGINVLIEKRLFWAVGGFHNDLITSEDKALAIEILKSGEKISTAPKAVSVARQHDGPSLSSNPLPRLKFAFKYRKEIKFSTFVRLVIRIIRLHLTKR